MGGTDFYISAYPHPQYIGSVPQAYHVSSVHEHIGLSLVVSSVSVCIATELGYLQSQLRLQ
jgi:hypothetical protein